MNLISEIKVEYFLFLPLILFALIFFQKKTNFLIDNTKSSHHKTLTGSLDKKTPLSGGLFIMLSLIIFFQDKDII